MGNRILLNRCIIRIIRRQRLFIFDIISGKSIFYKNKVVSYAYLYELIGEEVHEFVGEEPSGA